MKALRTIRTTTALWLAGVAPALAAEGARTDHSGILVWVFLGVCALIVVAQVMPAAFLLFGMVKGALESRKLARQTAHK